MSFEEIKQYDIKNLTHLQPKGWTNILPEFEFYVKSSYCKAIMKKSGKKIIAVGASIRFKNTAWIAHIIVDKNFRRQGLGYTITEDLLKTLDKQSTESTILIATELGKPVYKKLGFNTESEYVYFNRELSKDINISQPINIEEFRKEYYDDLIKLDKKITGEIREHLIKDYLKDSKLFMKKNKIEGFYLPSLGEGPIIAENDEAGINLMKIKYSKSNYAVIPEENTAGINFLEANGFKKSEKSGTRMIRGIKIEWIPKKIFSRIGGNFG